MTDIPPLDPASPKGIQVARNLSARIAEILINARLRAEVEALSAPEQISA